MGLFRRTGLRRNCAFGGERDTHKKREGVCVCVRERERERGRERERECVRERER